MTAGEGAVDWSRSVVVLVTPDGVARHLARPILERVEAAGFTPTHCRPCWLGPEDLDAMYRSNIDFVWDTFRYRLLDQLFQLGPSLAVVLADLGQDGEPHARLTRLKGATNPYRAAPGTIRRDLGGINSVLGLMHGSDSPEEAAYDSSILLPGDMGAWAATPEGVRRRCRLLERAVTPETRGFADVVGGLRARVLAALWPAVGEGGRRAARDLLARCGGPAALRARGRGAALAAELGLAGEPLLDVLAAEFDPDDPGPEPEAVQRLLGAAGLGLDRWESLVITTSRVFRPLRPQVPSPPEGEG
jgi:nucleoside diphosphate kinase